MCCGILCTRTHIVCTLYYCRYQNLWKRPTIRVRCWSSPTFLEYFSSCNIHLLSHLASSASLGPDRVRTLACTDSFILTSWFFCLKLDHEPLRNPFPHTGAKKLRLGLAAPDSANKGELCAIALPAIFSILLLLLNFWQSRRSWTIDIKRKRKFISCNIMQL